MSRRIIMFAVAATLLLLSACGGSDGNQDDSASVETTPKVTCKFNASGTLREFSPKSDKGLIRGNAKVNKIPFSVSRDIVKGTPRVGARVTFFYEATPQGPKATCIRVSRLDG